jgi:hypothetical protein
MSLITCRMTAGSIPDVDPSPRWWQWPTVLSLDAPAVALLWQWQLADAGNCALGFAPRFVLGASVWLAYAGDRWFEGWRLDPGSVRTQRHLFHQRRRWPIAAAAAAVLAADLAVAVRGLSPRDLTAGLLLLGPVLAYLLSHQLIHRHRPWRLPKEVCVALLFGGGAAIFLVSQPGADLRLIGIPLGLFILLCFANCALISVWEHAVDRSHGQVSLAGQFRGGAAFSRALPWALALVSPICWLASPAAARPTVLCAVASSVLLGVVDQAEFLLGWRLSRVLADAALMTPIAIIVRRWLLR